MTLVENDIDPLAWLTDVLARLPDHPASASTNSCPGIGTGRQPPPKPPEQVQ